MRMLEHTNSVHKHFYVLRFINYQWGFSDITMFGVNLFFVFGDRVSLSLYAKGLLNLDNLYILLHQFVMEAVWNVWIVFNIGRTDQPKTLSHAAIMLG
jgi:hypothetical protein